MFTIPHVGAFVAGGVVVYVTLMFLRRARSFTVKGLGSLVTILFGGGAVTLISTHLSDQKDPNLLWFYVFGLPAGFVAYVVYSILTIVISDDHGSGALKRAIGEVGKITRLR
jgi:hypothetical protein